MTIHGITFKCSRCHDQVFVSDIVNMGHVIELWADCYVCNIRNTFNVDILITRLALGPDLKAAKTAHAN